MSNTKNDLFDTPNRRNLLNQAARYPQAQARLQPNQKHALEPLPFEQPPGKRRRSPGRSARSIAQGKATFVTPPTVDGLYVLAGSFLDDTNPNM